MKLFCHPGDADSRWQNDDLAVAAGHGDDCGAIIDHFRQWQSPICRAFGTKPTFLDDGGNWYWISDGNSQYLITSGLSLTGDFAHSCVISVLTGLGDDRLSVFVDVTSESYPIMDDNSTDTALSLLTGDPDFVIDGATYVHGSNNRDYLHAALLDSGPTILQCGTEGKPLDLPALGVLKTNGYVSTGNARIQPLDMGVEMIMPASVFTANSALIHKFIKQEYGLTV